ncbi:MAG: hypothetical protein ACYC5O_10240 [Anaerolineae bacterium]
MGVIDSLSEGLALVRRRPLIMAIPVVVDLAIWLAPQLSVQPLAESLARGVQASAALAPQTTESVQAAKDLLLSVGQHANLAGLLSAGIVGVPSVVSGGMPAGTTNLGGALLMSNPLVAALAALVLAIAGLMVASLYLTTIAGFIRGDKPSLSGMLRNTVRVWGKLLLLGVALLVLAVAVTVPVTLSVSLLSIVSPTVAAFLASLLGLFGLWVGIWVLFYLFFVVDAMVLQEAGLQRAIVNSIVVVRSSFWSAVGFIVLLNLIAAGLSVVWQWLAEATTVGLVAAIAGNAFIGSGLAAASLFFYRDRYEAWRKRVLERGGK